MATACYMEMVTRMTGSESDQGHIHMLIDSNPAIPDRTRFILGLSDENPYPILLESGRGLVRGGAEVLAIPCNTSHYFYDDLQAELGVKILHLIKDTVSYVKTAGYTSAGFMATDGTVQTGLYQKAIEEAGMRAVSPDPDYQRLVMRTIYDEVKAGRPVDLAAFESVGSHLKDKGAQVVILGCTELSVVKNMHHISAGYIDAMEVMARNAVLACGAPLKSEYNDLITK